MIESILVPVDGSEHSKKALDFACQLALKFNADLSLLYVAEANDSDQYLFMGSARVVVPGSSENAQETGQSVIDAATEIANQQGCEIKNKVVTFGSTAKMILEYADNHAIDTIVLGSRGLGNVGGMLLGSVSHKVSHLTKCTCITVR